MHCSVALLIVHSYYFINNLKLLCNPLLSLQDYVSLRYFAKVQL